MKTLKRVLAIAFIVAIGCTAFAFTSTKEGDVPQKVKEAFAKKFPTVKKVKWDKESTTEWEAEFKMNKVEYSANFLEDGTWNETEHEILSNDIPKAVQNSIKTSFSGYKVKEQEVSETPSSKVYEFEIKKGKEVLEVAFDSSGIMVKKEVVKKDDDDDNND